MRALGITVGALLVAAAIVWLVSRSRNEAPEPAVDENSAEQSVSKLISEARPAAARRSPAARAKKVATEKDDDEAEVLDAWVEELPERDRKLGQAIVDASDKDDLAALKLLVDEARQSPNADVRQRMVEALGWFGKDAVGELSKFLTDANAEVAQSAFSEWDSAVDAVEDENFGLVASMEAMKVLTDEDNLQTAACRIESADDRKAAIEAIVEIVGSGNATAEKVAKESYEFITGDEWVDAETAAAKAATINDED